MIDSNGFQKYGRMVVNSEDAELYLIPVDKLTWMFNEEDK